MAQMLPPGGGGGLTNTPLASWSFNDTNTWTSDSSNAPISFSNITGSWFGDGTSVTLNSTNPGWLNYNVYEATGATNLTVDQGSFFFWFAPAWAGTNEGGSGPGQWGRLIEVGAYTTGANFGWWSLYCDPAGANLYFSVQPGDGSSTTYLTAPIAWTSNYWHFVALTYCATNTALYMDGMLATNGPGLSNWPGTNVLAGGFYLGSSSNGLNQASGSFDDLYTYNVPLGVSAIANGFNSFWPDYYLTPENYMADIISAPSNPSTTPTFNAVTGSGFLTPVTTNTSCITSSNVWITNILAFAVGTNMAVQFTIAGGSNGIPYDVFANSILDFSSNTNLSWAWMGQGYQCVTYILTNLPTTDCFIILGTPQDSDSDGLTDAYERLVSKTDPNNPNSSGDGMLDGWKVLWGMNPSINNSAQPSERANLLYDGISRLKSDTGIVNEAFGFDAQGNIQLDQP
jgi:hypothetical protein